MQSVNVDKKQFVFNKIPLDYLLSGIDNESYNIITNIYFFTSINQGNAIQS